MVAEEEAQVESEDDEDAVDIVAPPKNFEFGSGYGVGNYQEGVVSTQTPQQPPTLQITDSAPIREPAPMRESDIEMMGTNLQLDNGFSDWADEEHNDRAPITLMNFQGTESIPSDWEKLVDDHSVSDMKITEEDMLLMQELENEMILDGLLTNDDLLGDELMEDE